MSGNTITRFMWPFQLLFRSIIQSSADRVFQELDHRFLPEVFLVGIRVLERDDRFLACVEPEKDFWILSEQFDNTLDLAQSMLQHDPESKLICSLQSAQEMVDERLLRRSIREAIFQIIDNCKSRPKENTYFVSLPGFVDGFLISAVLGLQTNLIDAYPKLEKSTVEIHKYREHEVPISLVDATVKAFFRQVEREIEQPKAGQEIGIISAQDTLRNAASIFMNSVVWRIDRNCIAGMGTLYDSFKTTAALRYENEVGNGVIALARKEHPAIRPQIHFANPTSFTNARASRKLLELASCQVPIHSNSEQLFGLVEVVEYDTTQEDLFLVEITGHHEWSLYHADNCLMRVKFGQPELPRGTLDAGKLSSDLERIFSKITKAQIQKIVALVEEAEKETHGTMLLLSEDAESESERLKTQGTVIEPIPLTPSLLGQLTSIDGAVILSPEGKCYAIGMILDGMSSDKGDPARGARYNSAIKYVETSASPCFAIVISEDGGTDFFPRMRPMIKRKWIDDTISTLQKLDKTKTASLRKFNEAKSWIDKLRFYLLAKDCKLLNQLIPRLQNRVDAQSGTQIFINTRAYEVDPEMKPAIYYEEQFRKKVKKHK